MLVGESVRDFRLFMEIVGPEDMSNLIMMTIFIYIIFTLIQSYSTSNFIAVSHFTSQAIHPVLSCDRVLSAFAVS